MTALMGTFVNIKTMADGTPRLVLDLQCTLSEIAAMGLIPGVPFAIARLEKAAATTPQAAPAPEPKTKPGELCVMACTFCADPLFWKWVARYLDRDCVDKESAKAAILKQCVIKSRKDLDTDTDAAHVFHETIRRPYTAWRSKQ